MESQTVWYQCCVFTMRLQGMSTKEAIRDQVPLLYTWNHGIVTSLISWTWGRTLEKKNRYRNRCISLFTSLHDIHGEPCYKLKLFKNMAVCVCDKSTCRSWWPQNGPSLTVVVWSYRNFKIPISIIGRCN